MSNTFGKIYRLTSFGESHGPALGGVIDGCPPGIRLDFDRLNRQMARRRPGQSAITTPRKESDNVTFLSGILNGVTTGAPIGFSIPNTNTRSADYKAISQSFRPNHADFTYFVKYRGFNDIRGGGRSSARETASRVVAGAIAMQVLQSYMPRLTVTAFTQSIGEVSLDTDYTNVDLSEDSIESNPVRCPDAEVAQQMESVILAAKSAGDSVGGVVRCIISGCPAGIGQPVFDKLSARLAFAMMSINAAKGFQIGDGFAMATSLGSQVMDNWTGGNPEKGYLEASSNHSGGIQGGISNGQDIFFDVAFKPVATLMQPIKTVDIQGKPVTLEPHGRHDPCVVPRAIPIVESMTAMVLLDQFLLNRAGSL